MTSSRLVVPLLAALLSWHVSVYAQDASSVALVKLATTSGIDYVLPKELLDILNSAAILTAFYTRVDKSVVRHLTSQSTSQIAQLPSDYQYDASAKSVQLGAVLPPNASPSQLLISSFIPFSWDDMNGYFSIFQVLIHQTNAIKTMSLESVVASAAVIAIGPGLDPASCPPKSKCSEELQQVIFDAVNTLVLQIVIHKWYSGCDKWDNNCRTMAHSVYAHVWPSDLPIPPPPPSSSQEQSRRRQQSSSSSSDIAQQRARQATWAKDQLSKNTINKSVKKKNGVFAAALRGLQVAGSSGVSIAFSTQLNTNLLSVASGGYCLPDSDVVVSVFSSAFAGLSSQIAKSAQKLMTTGYLDESLNTVKASSPFVQALAAGTAVAGGITDTTFTVIQADMSDVGISDIYGTTPPTPTAYLQLWQPQSSSPTPVPVRAVVSSPTLMPIRPSPTPSSAPLWPPTRAPLPLPVPAPVAKPVPIKPTSKPTSKPVARQPTRRPTKRPSPAPTSADDGEYYGT